MDVSLSPDGTQVMLSDLYLQDGALKNRIVFYNFSEYGKNYPDRLVGGFDELGDSICPRVRFLDEDHACAFADDQVAFFSLENVTSPALVRQAEIDYAYAAAEKAESEDVSFEVDENGMLKSFRAAGREYLAGAAKLQILRAYLDNDRNVKNDWERVRYQYADFFAKNIERKEGCVRVSGYMVTDSIAPLAEICLTYKPVAGGVEIFAEVFGNGHFPRFPRFGFSFPVAPSLTKVEYFGRGETEAYLDRTLCAPVGFYVADARTMNYMYPKPQESGSHCGSRFVKISDGKGGIMADSEKDFSFQVSEYALSDYRAHAYEMKETGRLYLNVDYKMGGVGSASCGPVLEDKYWVEHTFGFRFRLLAAAGDPFKRHFSK